MKMKIRNERQRNMLIKCVINLVNIFINGFVFEDIIDGLITCNHTLKSKSILEILTKMDLWIKQRNEPKPIQIKSELAANIKLFKARTRQLVWDLMEMK